MPGRSGAPVLFGRENEQDELYDALALALKADPQVVVVAGDAGVGKTTLVGDLAHRARDLGFGVAVGHCLDIDADISFAPFVEAVRTLVAAAETESRPFARRLRGLLEPDSPSGTDRVTFMDDLRLTVLEAATVGPVLLVVEDLHWADTSTRDLAVALARTARGRLMLVLTVRRDDLHRRHPARRALAEIGRVPGGRRVELGPLDRDSITALMASLTGRASDPTTIESVLALSEGNPLYAEELAAAGPGTLPDHLSDLFLSRVDALSDGARALARTASVDGTRVDPDSLQALAGLDRPQTHAYLQELLDANVLRQLGETLVFWHPLLREAVYDDLLPDERTRLHAELAEILQAQADAEPEPRVSLLSRLAYHWSSAHDLPRTFVASVGAGSASMHFGAAECRKHLERAIDLWDEVPDAEALVGFPKVELILRLSRAVLNQGDGNGWHALNRRAVELLQPETDRLMTSMVHAAFAFSSLNIDDTADAPEHVRLALEYAGDEPSVERAYALGAQTLLHCNMGRFADALAAADRAIAAAEEVGAEDALLLDLMFKSEALISLGHVQAACDLARLRIDRARRAGHPVEALYCVDILIDRLKYAGKIDEAAAVARDARREGLTAGIAGPTGSCGARLVSTLTWQGRLDEAENLLAELGDLGLDEDPWWLERADLALARGDVRLAARVVPARFGNLVNTGPPPEAFDVMRVLQAAVLGDDSTQGLRTAEDFLSLVEAWDSAPFAAVAARIAFQVLTFAKVGPDPTAGLRDRAVHELARAREGLTDEWRVTYFGVQWALAEAYAARVAGTSALEEFRIAVELAEPFGAFFALEPRLELAQELLVRGARDDGRELLVECWTAAHEMGAGGLERRASKLATRMRVPLPETTVSEGPLSRLTPREREVLDQLASGATNKGIAEILVISEKTVSVHVSNVLSKLGVQNRGAAAALARQLSD